jgi:hypothetical protein
MPANPVEAGRKGGQSKSPAKLAACRRNGFQPVKPAPVPSAAAQPTLLLTTPREKSNADA